MDGVSAPYPQDFGGKVFGLLVAKRRFMKLCLNSSLILKCLLFNCQRVVKFALHGTRNSRMDTQLDPTAGG